MVSNYRRAFRLAQLGSALFEGVVMRGIEKWSVAKQKIESDGAWDENGRDYWRKALLKEIWWLYYNIVMVIGVK